MIVLLDIVSQLILANIEKIDYVDEAAEEWEQMAVKLRKDYDSKIGLEKRTRLAEAARPKIYPIPRQKNTPNEYSRRGIQATVY